MTKISTTTIGEFLEIYRNMRAHKADKPTWRRISNILDDAWGDKSDTAANLVPLETMTYRSLSRRRGMGPKLIKHFVDEILDVMPGIELDSFSFPKNYHFHNHTPSEKDLVVSVRQSKTRVHTYCVECGRPITAVGWRLAGKV